MSSDYEYESYDSDTLRQLDHLEEVGFGLAAELVGLEDVSTGHVFEAPHNPVPQEPVLASDVSLDNDVAPPSLPSSAPVIVAGARKRKKVLHRSSSPTQEALPSKKRRFASYPTNLKTGISTAEAAVHLDVDAVHSGSETSAGQESVEEEEGNVAGLIAEPGGTQGSSSSYDQQAVYMQSLRPSQGHSSNEDEAHEPARVSQVTSREDSTDEYERDSFLVSDGVIEREGAHDSG
ncbi:hypothetical protein PENSPDRAFT_691424 [Peniophora sp. CONT]|nr:hypothetical protein PENSPDRAFT_691424 [Peniophora sp. CONT]